MVKDDGPVLGSGIIPLPVQCRRVMYREEDFQNIAERDNGGVEGYLHHFDVAGITGANLLIRWIGSLASHISRDHRSDSGGFGVDGLHTPETPPAQSGSLL